MEAHGGYICRLDGIDTSALVTLARESLLDEGHGPADAALLVCLHPSRQFARLAFDAPFTYGRLGARWYKSHVALAKNVSQAFARNVHAYVLDPQEEEGVISFVMGQKAKSLALRYDMAELSDEDVDDETDEKAFERLKEKWPLGLLAKTFGVNRKEFLNLPRAQTIWLPLEGNFPQGDVLRVFDSMSSPRRMTGEFFLGTP